MIFAVRFHDKPDQLALRNSLLQAHLDWLALHGDTILIAGPLREVPDEGAVGGLWIVRAADRAEVEALVQTDPF
ncbi:YciI family protein [Cupriavidus taiwanensis]|uniref:YciI family protein n=1 Tax=Cupriavidus taiwanensis TaxID=164546 RepID=UPI00253FE7C4|nr:YciI family protein [Cupriavidus taiwanensis]MDK3023560.1 YciI family protein [Cupriavidus taiwanensis]